jgi:glycine/D-amino acid oxidase-like deaminating enzyme
VSERVGVVVVGAGQAGLATSHELSKRGISHVVLERGRIGEAWRGRWESFSLVTPNWSMQLPDQPFDGDDPDAFEPRDEIVGFLERYASTGDTPLREGVEVRRLDPSARLFANILAGGHGGDHDLHLRTLHERGVTLLGHFSGAAGREARFEADLGRSVDWGDQRFRELREVFSKFAAQRGIAAPEIPDPAPLEADPPEHLDLSGFGAVIFAGGFRPDYASWVNVPGAFDKLGFPLHEGGASLAAPGLYFVGVHFLRTRKSSLFIGVGDDARVVAEGIAAGEPDARRSAA